MTRSEFLQHTALAACGSCAAAVLGSSAAHAADVSPSASTTPVDEALRRAQSENLFTNNWLTDLFDTIEAELDPATKLKLMTGCGRGCFNRHKFKQDIAEAGKGDVEKLVAAYRTRFGIRYEAGMLHITYGGGKCFCPAARNRPARPNDLHCECTRATHQTLCETALGRPIKVELLETVRRGGQRCHIVAHVG